LILPEAADCASEYAHPPLETLIESTLPEDQKRALQQMNDDLSMQRSGGLRRHVTANFLDHTAAAASREDGRDVDMMADQCR
jgi:hypothetical protein